MVRVSVGTKYKVHIHTQDILVVPGMEPKVELDNFVRAQLKAKTLLEVK